ncbi:hypothetical protein BES08_11075 [Novosphingobium resinovorum]|uniref:Uncharacterized protein n=2 Tax=Novosphingobium resinovorum TaxID=158500 RepID=A0A1D8A547_9SPHN|nr:hypothetical protein BES08_11075 [Novosphingobium resinovorum]
MLGEIAVDDGSGRLRAGDGVTPGGQVGALVSDLVPLAARLSLAEGTITSGRLAYSLWSQLNANTTAVYGTVAEVPITDTGTHTDPVVGGVVNNSGVFKKESAGWQRLYDVDAAAAGAARDQAVAAAATAQTATAAVATAGIGTYFTNSGYISSSGGQVMANAGWVCTDFLDASLFFTADISLIGDPGAYSVACFTEDWTVIPAGSVAAAAAGGVVTAAPARPADAAWVRYSARTPVGAQRFIPTEKNPSYLRGAANGDLLSDGNLFWGNTRRGYWTSATAPVLNNDANYRYSAPIRVYPGSVGGLKVDYDLWAAAAISPLFFLDANLNVIQSKRVAGAAGRVVGAVTVPPGASFTADISGTTMNVTVMAAGQSLAIGDEIQGSGVTAGTIVTAYGTATGALGTYTISISQTVASGPMTSPAAAFFQFSGGNPRVFSAARAAGSRVVVSPAAVTPPANTDLASGNLTPYATTFGFVTTAGTTPNSDSNWYRASTPLRGAVAGRFVIYDAYASTGMNVITAYDASGVVVGKVDGTGNYARMRGAYQLPANTASFHICYARNYPATVRYEISLPFTADAIIPPTGVFATYGDSRSSSDYAFIKAAGESRLGCTVSLQGKSGHTAQQLASDADLASLFALSPVPHGAWFYPGGNDTGGSGSVGTFSAGSINGVGGEAVVSPLAVNTATPEAGLKYIQYIDLVIQKMLAQWNNRRARANLTGSETEAERDAKMGAVIVPKIIMLCGDQQQRIDAANAFSLPANHERKRQAELEVARFRRVEFIDLYAMLPTDMSLEPYYPGVTDKVNNLGNDFMDGLHRNRFGIDKVFCLVAGYAGYAA